MTTMRIAFPFLMLLANLAAQEAGVPYDDRDFLQKEILGKIRARSIGPANYGGRILDFAVDAANPSTYFVATASGGVFRTTNRGQTFAPIFDDQNVTSIGDIAVAPSNAQMVWVGTGEANNQRSSYWGDGIYKSADGGKTWKHMGLRGTDHIGRIAIHPRNPDIVYVAALGALYTPNKERGLYRTRDGGKTWTCVKQLGEDVGFVDVAIDPVNSEQIYASSYERRRRAWNISYGGQGSAIWKSDDAGDTWKRLEGGLPSGEIGRIGLDAFLGGEGITYAVVENLNPAPTGRGVERPTSDGEPEQAPIRRDNDPDVLDADRDERDAVPQAQDRAQGSRRRVIGSEVYRTNDGGVTWTRTGAAGGSPNYYYGQIRVDPTDAEKVYVLGVQAQASSDGGKTWRSNLGTGLHVDHHALWIDPKDGNHMLLGNDGGFGESYDGGKHWDFLNDLAIGQFYAIGVDNRDPYWVYGGLQDNGTWGIPVRSTTTSGLTRADAKRINGGDGFYVCVDPTDPNIVYSESQFGGVGRQDLRTGANRSIKPAADRGMPPARFNWMTPILISPHDPRTIYVCSQYVHRSRNRGDRFETISQDLTTADKEKLAGNVPHCTITTIDESPRTAGKLLVGTDDGKVWLTKNGGALWEDLGKRFTGLPMALWVSRVHWSPHDAQIAYVSFTGYREDHRKPYLFITTDGGETWRSIVNDLPESPINVVREHPRNHNVIFVGQENGLRVSIDGGTSWQTLAGGMPAALPVHDLVVHPREADLVVGTHGRGIWIFDIAVLEEANAAITSQAITLAPARNGWLLRSAPNHGFRGARNWVARNPELNPVFRYVLSQDADSQVKIEVLDAAEKVLFTTNGSSKAGLQEIVWNPRGAGGPGGGRGGNRGAGAGQGGAGRGSAPQVAAGQYRLRVTLGETKLERTFKVNVGPDYAPGFQFGTDEEEDGDEEVDGEERAEREALRRDR